MSRCQLPLRAVLMIGLLSAFAPCTLQATPAGKPMDHARLADASQRRLPLPASGVDGERYQVEHTRPEGNREAWTYEWRGGRRGSGVTVGYDYHMAASAKDRTAPNRGPR